MYFRTNFRPKSYVDAFVLSFVIIIIPVIYYFELFIILPIYYTPYQLTYYLHNLAAVFILYNLVGNLIAIIVYDTSIKGRILPSKPEPDWRFCSVCESVAPPRSWHCDTCNVCILKREHHCMFTGCCIGHANHRYFLMFVFYVFLGTMYATYFNVPVLYKYCHLSGWISVLKVIFPLASLSLGWTVEQLYSLFIIIVILAAAFTGALFQFHGNLVLKGIVTYERNAVNKYDKGWKKNVEVVLGERWHLVWLSPWIESKLPCDGIDWSDYLSTKQR